MFRPTRLVLALVVLLFAASLAPADDKAKGLSGTWAQKEGETKIVFSGKDVVKFVPHGDEAVIAIACKFTIDEDGVVKAKVTGLEGKDEIKEKAKNIMPVGLEFSFKWTVKDEEASLDDLKGENLDGFKSKLEGKYEEKK